MEVQLCQELPDHLQVKILSIARNVTGFNPVDVYPFYFFHDRLCPLTHFARAKFDDSLSAATFLLDGPLGVQECHGLLHHPIPMSVAPSTVVCLLPNPAVPLCRGRLYLMTSS